ncbi:BTAD domain-containing putative transcriptional regulator [Nocardioides sp. T5]|uniref:BTAD domain-containing putative transcriptional regulator n=1 Tax=Nocardioides sp. T5 TaxID=3400182 RepID=UPI003A8B8A9D
MQGGQGVIEVLGPLQVRHGDEPITVGSARHREVLAALVVDVGRVVSVDALLERVWGGAGRGASASNLHAVMSRLRSRLAGLPGVSISTVSPGYRLEAADGTVDAVVFVEGFARAREHHARGDLAATRRELDAALAAWRDTAYADVRLPFAEVEAARLEGIRVSAFELLVEVELAQGRVREALDHLTPLVSEHPLREAFRRHQMLALYRAGRQAEALEVYADLRHLLAEELGIDPGPQLQELHQRILAHDDDLLPAAQEAPPTEDAPASRPVAGLSWHSDVVVPADDLVGRGRDVDYLVDLLTASPQRLVTVTGVGGVGKTRLAYAVAEASRDAFPGGVCITSLIAVTDEHVVLPTIGRGLGLSGVEGQDAFDVVAQHVRGARTLLVVDNFEHVLDAAPVLARLVATCPLLSILVTSRTTLRVRGELQYQLAPLSLPGPGVGHPDAAAASTAIELFVARARSARAGFELDEGNVGAVSSICRRLAGIPLALELAAARTPLLPPAAMLERLDRVMATAGARDLPARQRTMRSAIDWSYQLLNPDEQRLFRQLAVFADGFTLEAVEALRPRDDADSLAALESLTSHSLVLRDLDHPEAVRFRMLEPIAQFADSRLEGVEATDARDAHLHYFLDLIERTAAGFRGHATRASLAVTEREHANLTSAIEWALASERGELAGRACWAMWLYWWLRGHLHEGRRLTQATLAHDLTGPTRTRVTAVLGAMAFAQGDLQAATCWGEGAALGRSIGDIEGQAHNVAGEGLVALASGDLAAADTHLDATIALTESCGLRGGWLWTLAHVWLGTVRLLQGDPGKATPLLHDALTAARVREDPLAIYITLFTSVQVALTTGDLASARLQLREGISLSLDTGDMANLAYFLESLAVVESQSDDWRHVALLLGAADELRETVGSNVYGYYQPDEQVLSQTRAAAREHLGETYDDVLARGRRLSLDETVDLARRCTDVVA